MEKVDYAIFDGNFVPPNVESESDYLVKGDKKVVCVSAASILAKVTRERLMLEQAKLYPEYGFEKHKGYLTKWDKCKLKDFEFKSLVNCLFSLISSI